MKLNAYSFLNHIYLDTFIYGRTLIKTHVLLMAVKHNPSLISYNEVQQVFILNLGLPQGSQVITVVSGQLASLF